MKYIIHEGQDKPNDYLLGGKLDNKEKALLFSLKSRLGNNFKRDAGKPIINTQSKTNAAKFLASNRILKWMKGLDMLDGVTLKSSHAINVIPNNTNKGLWGGQGIFKFDIAQTQNVGIE